MSKPTIVFVPGIWEGPTVFSSVANTLSSPPHAYPTLLITLPNTGKISPANETLQGDVRGIQAQMEPLVEAGKEIILVMHSAGGFLGSNAIKGWSLEARRKEGKQGGVRKLVYLTAGLLPEGTMHEDLPFFDKDVSCSHYINYPFLPPPAPLPPLSSIPQDPISIFHISHPFQTPQTTSTPTPLFPL
jgi:pimeloyl-ACP methyl ester carboxylesterase